MCLQLSFELINTNFKLLMSMGSMFHNLGAQTENDLAPYVLLFRRGGVVLMIKEMSYRYFVIYGLE